MPENGKTDEVYFFKNKKFLDESLVSAKILVLLRPRRIPERGHHASA